MHSWQLWIKIIRDSFRESTSNGIKHEEQRAYPARRGFLKVFYQQKACLIQCLGNGTVLYSPYLKPTTVSMCLHVQTL